MKKQILILGGTIEGFYQDTVFGNVIEGGTSI